MNERTVGGRTALHGAALMGHSAAAELLLAYGAQVNARDALGKTPLHWAAQYGEQEVVGLLLTSGAEVHVRDTEGRTPLDMANGGEHWVTATLLRKYAASERSKSSNGED
ncbi:MAG: ankyrin repeat domain-containing protein [Candidatus Brocadiia bacterium]|nr:ankyrin repeat domain-containing protein [Candidatus Brocadiia bacterium]